MGKIDRKFIILAVNPINGKIYTDADGLFFCAKDILVPDMLAGYIESGKKHGADPVHLESMELARQRVVAFQDAMGGGRIPDTVGGEVARCIFGEGVE